MKARTARTSSFNPFEKQRKRFGELMLSSHYLSSEELTELLDLQKSAPKVRLGYLCLQRKFAAASEVMDVLLRQLPITVPYSS